MHTNNVISLNEYRRRESQIAELMNALPPCPDCNHLYVWCFYGPAACQDCPDSPDDAA